MFNMVTLGGQLVLQGVLFHVSRRYTRSSACVHKAKHSEDLKCMPPHADILQQLSTVILYRKLYILVIMQSTEVQALATIRLNIVTFGFKIPLRALGEHIMKTELCQTKRQNSRVYL